MCQLDVAWTACSVELSPKHFSFEIMGSRRMRPQCLTAVSHYQERGIALFMSLVILLILTILGVSSVQMTRMQKLMSRNSHDVNIAFLAAESAM